jgi:glycosyltransferase involved in cell wall biosynthesis
MSTIALCIPAFNAAKFLPALLKSALDQEIKFNEILLYNDCSTDETESVAKSFGVTVINGKKNQGCSFGKNELARIANSDWLHFHDSDDLLLNNFNQVAKRWIEKQDPPDILLLHFHYVDFDTKKLLDEPRYDRESLVADPVKFVIENKVVNFAIVNKNAFNKIGGFDTDKNVLYNEDKAFYAKAAIAGLTFDYEPENTCLNYSYNLSMSKSNLAKCSVAQFFVLQKINNVLQHRYRKEIAEQLYQNATFACVHSQWHILRSSVYLARSIAPRSKPIGGYLFIKLFNFSPQYSFLIREYFIRIFKRKLR